MRGHRSVRSIVFVAVFLPALAAAQTPLPTARPGLPPAAGKQALACGKALTKAANGLVAKKAARLKKCTDAVATCLQGAPTTFPACLERARGVCDASFAANAGDEGALVRAAAAACAQTTLADLRAEEGLGFGLGAFVAACADVGVAAPAGAADVAACLARVHGCAVERLLRVQVPLAPYLLGLVGRTAVNDQCSVDAPGPEPTARPGSVPATAAKDVVKCSKALTKAANGFVTRKAGLLKKCTDGVAACLQGKPAAQAACLVKARAKCDGVFAGIGKEETKLVAKVTEGCARVTNEDLLGESGLGFGLPALATACAAVGVPAIADAADVAACVARSHECRVEELLRVQVPLAAYLLGLVGRPVASDYCAPAQTPTPTSAPTPSGVPTGDPTATPTGPTPSGAAPTPTAIMPSGTGGTPTPLVPTASPTPAAAVVNPGLAPAQPSVTDAGLPLVVAASRDADGVQSDFVVGHLLVKPRDAGELDAFLGRYGGTIVRDDAVPEPPAELGITLTEEERAPRTYLVRIDLDQARVADVDANAAALGITGVMEFSTQDGLRTFAGLVDAGVQGFVVSGNFLEQGHQFPPYPYTLLKSEERLATPTPIVTRTATPTPVAGTTATATPSYTDPLSNAAFNDFGATGNQSNVRGAWQFIAAHGVTRPVVLAVIDGGFYLDALGFGLGPDSDFPIAPARALQYDVDFEDDIADGSNANGCSGGSKCYWHGTGAAATALGLGNNRRGAFGTGGQVAIPLLLRINGTTIQRNVAVRIAQLWNADVVSMSFGGDCNQACRIFDRDWNPFDTAVDEGSRAVFVASAGNGRAATAAPPGVATPAVGYPVGAPNFVHPCTEQFVLCVGALLPGGIAKFLYSNFGPEVAIFAPTNIQVMAYPQSFSTPAAPATPVPLPPAQAFGPPVPQSFGGTSAAAPFVAGVAALVKALQPDLNHVQVAQLLRDTAVPGVAPVTRTLDALAAVRQAAIGLAIVPDALEPNHLLLPTNLGTTSPYKRTNLNIDTPDRDYFQFSSDGGALMTVAISYPAPLAPISIERLESLGDCGRPAFVSEAARPGGGKNLVYSVPGGPMKLGLRADGVNAYNLDITFASGVFAPDEYEANDSVDVARFIYSFKALGDGPLASVSKDPRVKIDATIHTDLDSDWYLVRGVKMTGAEKILLAAQPAVAVFGNDSRIDLEVYQRTAGGALGALVASLEGAACTPTELTVPLVEDQYYFVRVSGGPGRYVVRNGIAGDPRKIPILVRDRIFEVLNPLDPITRTVRYREEAFVLVADPAYARIRTTTPGAHLRLFDFDGNAYAEGEALDPGPGEAIALAGTVPGAVYSLIVEATDDSDAPLELVIDPVEPTRVSANLVVNPGAEGTTGNPAAPFVGWDAVPGLPPAQPLTWDGQNGNPAATDPGPENRGQFLFFGGFGNPTAGLRQLFFIDQDWRAAVDDGRARFRFRAFLGGFADQADAASATITFFDVSQQPLGQPFTLPSVTALEREDQTALLPVEVQGVVPPSALFAYVEMRCTRAAGNSNDGYADNLEVVLSELP